MTNQEIISLWVRSNMRELYHAYNSYSYAKQEAFNRCREIQYKYNGYNGKILTCNSFVFTYAFEYRDENDTPKLCYITPTKIKHIKL